MNLTEYITSLYEQREQLSQDHAKLIAQANFVQGQIQAVNQILIGLAACTPALSTEPVSNGAASDNDKA